MRSSPFDGPYGPPCAALSSSRLPRETVQRMGKKGNREERRECRGWPGKGRENEGGERKKRIVHGRPVGCTVFTCRRPQVAAACVLRYIRFVDFLVDGQAPTEDFITPLKFMNMANSRPGPRAARIYWRRTGISEIYHALYMYVGL